MITERRSNAQVENFEHVWRVYGIDKGIADLQPALKMSASERAWLFRHHRRGSVSKRSEIRQRANLDALLHACGILEVGFGAGALTDSEGRCAAILGPILHNVEVGAFFEKHYPLRPPVLLRARIAANDLASEGQFDAGWFARFLGLDASFRDEQLDKFFKVVDSFFYGDFDFTSLEEVAKDADAIIEAVATPREDRTIPQEIIAGLERFLLFCRDLSLVLSRTDLKLQEATFDLYRYWFEVRPRKLARVVDDALAALAVDGIPNPDLPERKALAQLFKRAEAT